MKRGEGRPKRYLNSEAEKVSSVTEILKYAGDKSGLIRGGQKRWFERGYKAGRTGEDIGWMDVGWDDGDALFAGTIVHQWIDDDIHGNDLTVFDAPSLVKDQANIGFMAYRQWRNGVVLEVLETETPRISEAYQFGGTIDAVALLNGERVLFDWKTSKRVYPEYVVQVAAYRQLLNEEHARLGVGAPVESAYLLRVGKEYGDFTAKWFPSERLDRAWKGFLAAKKVMEIYKELEAVVK